MNANANWLGAFRIYIATTVTAHLIWEVAQLPLYTIWSTGTPREIIFAVVHCAGGDLLISTLSLVAALLVFGDRVWPIKRFIPVLVATIIVGLGYTVYSEWMNAVVRKTWAYSNLMPKLPLFGTGLSPLLQWIIIPSLGFTVISHLSLRPRPNNLA